jgi:hypothetical protein
MTYERDAVVRFELAASETFGQVVAESLSAQLYGSGRKVVEVVE